MQGDFTRFTHDAAKRYIGVLRQQGRLDVDADANEHFAIRERLARLTRIDVIGTNGAPQAGGGFAIGVSADGLDLTISAGRMYVDGILCELDAADATYTTQPHWPAPDELTDGDDDVDGRRDLVYLDVWYRHVSAVEDPDLLDPALNGLDTTTRLQTVWQVRVLKDTGDATCGDIADFPPAAPDGTLTIQAVETPSEADACDVVVAGGYRGVENRLYRVEIHDGGALGTATWKWSRDNGSVVLPIEELFAAPASQVRVQSLGRDAVLTLRQDDWVEIIDDAAELAGTPGFMARVASVNPATRIVTLDRDVPATFDVAQHARVRRWDQVLDIDADGLRTTGAGPFDLEDGIQVGFGGTTFRTGDWWAFAARTAGGTVEERTDAPPDGIAHAYAPLARIEWSDAGDDTFTAEVIEDCRETFPPLNDLCAEDICFDNGNCQLNGAETVQEALDLLCAARDLRFHNKHLHGWGIVCGLQVNCGPEDDDGTRRNVTVRTGYAIDCEGNDILVDENIEVDLLERVAALEEANPDAPILDDDGDGEVCLVLAGAAAGVSGDGLHLTHDSGTGLAHGNGNGNGNGNGHGHGNGLAPSIVVEPMGPVPPFFQRVLAGTIWRDAFDDCIQSLLGFIKGELTVDPNDPDEQGQLVGPTQRRITTLLNLLIQVVNPSNGRYVYLSAKEDAILRELYFGLRLLLQSKTFCAMFANARPFPDYPFPDETVSTAFGKGYQTRLRIDRDGERGYTVGAGETIHVYDLAAEEMIAELAFPGGAGVLVRDVAVSEDGKRLFAIAKLNSDTIFAVADIDGTSYTFRPVTVICDVELTTIAVVPDQPNVFAVGRGKGLYEINPDAVQERPKPLVEFNAVGHLVIPAPGGPAWATAAAVGAANTRYDRVLRVSLDGATTLAYQLADATGAQRSGDDDIAVLARPDGVGSRLYVVVDGGSASASKQLLVYDANPSLTVPGGPVAVVSGLENTGIGLGLVPGFVVLAFEDSYRLGLVSTETNQVVTLPGSQSVYRHPVQIAPRSIAVDAAGERAYVLNYFSNTLSVVPTEYLAPDRQLDLAALAQYRDDVLEAFADLLGGLLQYLKDCFCDHLLVDCPECDEEDRIYLACASIRGGEVYQVCNFSKRKYVKTFPTVEYWLSMVPIIPLVREAVRSFCCSVLPDWFSKLDAPQGAVVDNVATQPNRVKATHMAQGVTLTQNVRKADVWRDVGSRAGVLRRLGGDWLATAGTRPAVGVSPAPRTKQVVGQRTAVAQEELERAGITVAGVEAYDAGRGGANLIDFAKTGGRIPRDRPVTLYEENGVVKYYAVAPAPAAGGADVANLMTEIKAARTRVEATRADMDATRADMDATRAELSATRSALDAARAEVEGLRGQLEDTRRASDEALAARDREIATLRTSTERVDREIAELRNLRIEVDRIRRDFPPR